MILLASPTPARLVCVGLFVASALLSMTSDAAAQAYPQYQYQYAQPQAPVQTRRVYRTAFVFQDDHAAVMRTIFGGGFTFGNVRGAGFNAECALSFRLESRASYRGVHYYIMPDIGFVFIHHVAPVYYYTPPDDYVREQGVVEGRAIYASDFEEVRSTANAHHLLLGMVGIRLGIGRAEIADAYVLARGLLGSADDGEVAFGTMAGVGVEFLVGLIAIETVHIWNYAAGMGHAHGIRFNLHIDIIRGCAWLIREYV